MKPNEYYRLQFQMVDSRVVSILSKEQCFAKNAAEHFEEPRIEQHGTTLILSIWTTDHAQDDIPKRCQEAFRKIGIEVAPGVL